MHVLSKRCYFLEFLAPRASCEVKKPIKIYKNKVNESILYKNRLRHFDVMPSLYAYLAPFFVLKTERARNARRLISSSKFL